MIGERSVADRAPRPAGWEREAQLLRIADDSGNAVAWIAPQYGANCVGFAVRRQHGWVQVLHTQPPHLLRTRPSGSGCAVLFPFPGHVRGARYRWAGIEHQLAPLLPQQVTYAHGFARTETWRIVETSEHEVCLSLSTRHISAQTAADYPFDIFVVLRIRVVRGMLELLLEATNQGQQAAPVGLGLHPYFAAELFGGDRTVIRAELPGTMEHLLTESIPTGERRIVATTPLTPPAEGQSMLVARTELRRSAVTTLSSRLNRACLTIVATGCSDLVFYAPGDRPSVAVEPHSCPPGAASQPEGHPYGLPALASGASARLSMTLRVGDE